MEEFLGLPARPAKPRDRGWTHVIDKGLTLVEVSGLIDSAGDFIDIVKLGWGTSYVTANLREKLRLYAESGIPVVCGGTLLEAAVARGRMDDFRRWTVEKGFTHIEVSDGTIRMEREAKVELISSLAADFVVLSEVGTKDAEQIYAPYQWVAWIREEIAAGAFKVITEARESGTSGIFRGTGEVRSGLIDEIVHEIPLDKLLFEAPQKEQQAWFIRHLGPDVNLGNIPASEVIPLETLRLGLRSDTMTDLLLRDLPTV
ncbi:MAG TPA: phosphosulfolactate synthase [Gaiellales bacterium]|jgi:phosphosulfolactate synthase|nr:phosphosulfolactate synthase [Gaiellales bacterium]